MGYLNNSNRTLDAILTKKGREILSSGGDFNVTKLSHKLKAKDISYGTKIFMKEDPKELFIAVNEFYWNILIYMELLL